MTENTSATANKPNAIIVNISRFVLILVYASAETMVRKLAIATPLRCNSMWKTWNLWNM